MLQLVLLLILILVNAFFSASEIALISLNDNKVKAQADEGDRKALAIVGLLREPSRFLATIQIGITLAGFLASAVASESFSDPLANLLIASGLHLPLAWLKTASVFVVTLALSYFTLVFGELAPKRLAMNKSEPISRFVVSALTALSRIAAPFVKLLTLSTNGLVRLFGVDPMAKADEVTEEEIRLLIDVGEESGTIDQTEKEMINNIFEFDDMVVSDIMTHRTDIVGLDAEEELAGIIAIATKEQYSRLPVYEENIDNIVGILHVKDLVGMIGSGTVSYTH
ncbi:MAG: hemolysin family protein, partial [Clostridia bacterium]|nr:hemolysin family protein [Clostridia bacterium]